MNKLTTALEIMLSDNYEETILPNGNIHLYADDKHVIISYNAYTKLQQAIIYQKLKDKKQ